MDVGVAVRVSQVPWWVVIPGGFFGCILFVQGPAGCVRLVALLVWRVAPSALCGLVVRRFWLACLWLVACAWLALSCLDSFVWLAVFISTLTVVMPGLALSEAYHPWWKYICCHRLPLSCLRGLVCGVVVVLSFGPAVLWPRSSFWVVLFPWL